MAVAERAVVGRAEVEVDTLSEWEVRGMRYTGTGFFTKQTKNHG
jgi:hypothetical protein